MEHARLLLIALVTLATAGCPRPALPAPPDGGEDPPVLARPGERCAAAADCATGFCQDQVCCDRECASKEACNLVRAVGVCTPRAPADPCDGDADCPTGSCRDGVCCTSPCNGACESCALPGHEGQCVQVPDNQDPRRSCSTCAACFGGFCLPAIPGTDPGLDCDAGQACSAVSTCATAGLGTCTQHADCAVGQCMAGHCLRAVSQVLPVVWNTLATEVSVFAVSANSHGRLAVLLHEFTPRAPDDLGYGTHRYLAVQQQAEGWSTTEVLRRDDCRAYWFHAGHALVAVGSVTVAVVNNVYDYGDESCDDGAPEGILAVWLNEEGIELRRDLLPVAPHFPASWISAAFNNQDELAVGLGLVDVLGTHGYSAHLLRYGLGSGTWRADPGRVQDPSNAYGQVLYDQGVLTLAAGGALAGENGWAREVAVVRAPAGQDFTVDRFATPDCTALSVSAVLTPGVPGSGIQLGVACFSEGSSLALGWLTWRERGFQGWERITGTGGLALDSWWGTTVSMGAAAAGMVLDCEAVRGLVLASPRPSGGWAASELASWIYANNDFLYLATTDRGGLPVLAYSIEPDPDYPRPPMVTVMTLETTLAGR